MIPIIPMTKRIFFLVGAGVLTAGLGLGLARLFPQALALNDTTKVWTFSADRAGDYTTSLVAVDDTGAHPTGGQTGANELVNPSFASDNSSWSVAAVPPAGWIEVPGDSDLYGTENFLVMKYEAKNDGSGNAVSQAAGTPYVSISQTDSISKCAAATVGSTNAHLITNEEWMTIARDAEAQSANWFGGVVGTNFLFSGHNDNGPASTLVASGDDDAGYTGTNDSADSCDGVYTNFSAGDDTTSGRACVGQKRTFTLSNGAVIWDLSGNVWEWVNEAITCADTVCTTEEMPYTSSPDSNWHEFPDLATYGSFTWDDLGPAGTGYDAAESVGRIYTDANAAVPSGNDHAFLRGGYWTGGANAGAFALDLRNAPSRSHTGIGFRCASDPVAILHSFSSSAGRGAAGADLFSVGTVTDGKLYQSVNLGDTATYDFSAYVYNHTTDEMGGTVNASVAELYYGGNPVSDVAYTAVTGEAGWYKLTGTVTGVAEDVETGLLVKAGKEIIVDDFTLSRQGEYSVFTTTAYTNSNVQSWDSFSATETASGNASVVYQLCADDGSTCESGSSWQYWDGDSWETAADTTTHINPADELTQTAMQALPTASLKISVKAIFAFGGADVPYLPHVSVGLTRDTTAPTDTDSGLPLYSPLSLRRLQRRHPADSRLQKSRRRPLRSLLLHRLS